MMKSYKGLLCQSLEHTLPDGTKIDLYYIGTLANALGRTPNTIRAWEVSGAIPDTFFKDKHGRRLYSADQINVMVSAAERSKIAQGKALRNTSFSRWVYKGFEELREKYKKGANSNANSKED